VSLRLPEPGSFEDLLRPARIEVASLVRLSRHPATEPYWSAGVHRFDDPDFGGAGAFGTCYTASSIEVAFAESVIHESGRFAGGTYEVPATELTERSVVRFICERRKTLVLADLTGAALKALGLNNDISASADYTTSQAWARAIHDANPRWDGIRYVAHSPARRDEARHTPFQLCQREALHRATPGRPHAAQPSSQLCFGRGAQLRDALRRPLQLLDERAHLHQHHVAGKLLLPVPVLRLHRARRQRRLVTARQLQRLPVPVSAFRARMRRRWPWAA